MKLVIFDVSRFDEVSLRPWCNDADAVNLTVIPLNGGTWRSTPIEVPPFESIAQHHEALFAPLLDVGRRDVGPRLPCAAVSFLAATDFTLYYDFRFPLAVIASGDRLIRQHSIDRIEFVTDVAYSDRYFGAAKVLAESHRLPLSRVGLSAAPLGWSRRAARLVDSLAERFSSVGLPISNVIRDRLHRRRLQSPHLRASRQRPGCSAEPTVRAAMLVYHAKSWRYVLPIRQRLLERGHDVLLISPRLESDRVLADAGVEFVSVRPALRSLRGARAAVRSLTQLTWKDGGELAQLMAPDGPLSRLISRVAVHAWVTYHSLAEELPALFRQHQINVVLGTDSGSVAGRCFFRTAEKMNIKTVFVQHGAIHVGIAVPHYMLQSHRLVWGQTSADNLVASEVQNPERIHCLGSPFHEEKLGQVDAVQAPTDLTTAPLVLVAFGVPGGFAIEREFDLAAGIVFAAAGQLPDARFVIKLHPGDPGRIWRQHFEQSRPANVEIHGKGDTYALLRACKILITMFSTTGAEAAWLGKPVISINPDGRVFGVDFVMGGAAYTLRDPDSLVKLLRQLVDAPAGGDSLAEARQRFAESFMHKEPRSAVDRAVDFLENLVHVRGAQPALRT